MPFLSILDCILGIKLLVIYPKCPSSRVPRDPALRGIQSADAQGTSGGACPGRARARARNPLPTAAVEGPEEELQELNQCGDVGGEHAEGEHAPSPRHCLRERRAYWAATMPVMGLVCALALSVLSGGFRMDWDPVKGPAPPAFLRNHPSALAEAAFVLDAILSGVAAELICILPLGVAFNSAGKRRLIWDGRHVNRHLRKRPFRMETLQREGRALFECRSFGGTLNVSSAYHHVDMAPVAFPYLGFEWDG